MEPLQRGPAWTGAYYTPERNGEGWRMMPDLGGNGSSAAPPRCDHGSDRTCRLPAAVRAEPSDGRYWAWRMASRGRGYLRHGNVRWAGARCAAPLDPIATAATVMGWAKRAALQRLVHGTGEAAGRGMPERCMPLRIRYACPAKSGFISGRRRVWETFRRSGRWRAGWCQRRRAS